MTSKTPKHTPNNSQTQVKTAGGVSPVISDIRKQFLDTLENVKERKISEILKENQVSQRIFFIRHGITIEDEKPENEGKPQSKESELSEDGIKQLNNTAKLLKESGIKPEETLFIYSDDNTARVQESMGIILEEFGLNLNSSQVEKNEKLNTSEKKETENGPEYHQDEYRLLIDMGVMVETIKLMKEIRTEEKYRKYKNIVLVGHKSNKAGITESVTNTDRPIRGDVSIKNGEILESDIGANGKYINYQKNKDILFVNSYNYKELKEIFPTDKFPQLKHSSIIEFHNKLNVYFMEKQELFGKYISKGNVDLRAFCVVNLLKNNEEIMLIEKYYKNINKSVSEKEEQVLWENRENSYIYNILGLLAKKGLLADPSMKYNFEDYIKILNIQSRSLDEKIKKQESDGILKRNLFLVEKKEIETRDKDGKTEKRIEYTNKSIDISEIILSTSKYILPAHVGNGKSIWLSEFAKKAILDYPEYKIYFFEGSDFNGDNKDNNFNKIKELLENQKENILIFVDAIDEINDSDMKSEIKNLLQQTKNKTIITARLSEYNDKENIGFKTLGFSPISKDEFINSRISDEKIKGEISKTLESSNLSHEIEGNPLLLNFVCILANLNEKDKKKYESLGIKSLENILNKADLYESVSRLIIYKHNETKGVILSEEELDFAIENLAKNAFNLFKGNKLKISDKQTQKSSIIFKKSENQDEYQFIHNSFYEFFLARHLVNIPNGNEEIYKIRDDNENNWNKWRKFKPVVMFYGESLINSEKQEQFERLENLLNGLLENDDIFGEGFFMGLKLLYRIEKDGKLNERFEKIKEKYLEIIEKWNKKDILNYIINFQDFQKKIGYKKNKFVYIYQIKLLDIYGTTFFIYNYTEVIKLGNKNIIKWALFLILDLEKHGEIGSIRYMFRDLITYIGNEEIMNRYIKFISNLEKNNKFKEILEFCEDFVFYGDKKQKIIIEYYINLAKKLEKNGRYTEAISIYNDLLRIQIIEVEKPALNLAKKLEKNGIFEELLKGLNIYLNNLNNKKFMSENKTANKKLFSKGLLAKDICHIYRQLASNIDYNTIDRVLNLGKKTKKIPLFEIETFNNYKHLLKITRNPKIIEQAIGYARKIKPILAIGIYDILIANGNKKAIFLKKKALVKALNIIGKLEDKLKYGEAFNEYYSIVLLTGNEEALVKALNIIGKLEDKLKYGEDYINLLTIGYPITQKPILDFIKDFGEKLESKYIIEFIKTGDQEIIDQLQKFIEKKERKFSFILKKGIDEHFLEILNMYTELINNGDLEAIKGINNLAKKIVKKGHTTAIMEILKKLKKLNLKLT